MSNRMDPDQARRFVGPDLDPNCLQKLSADETLAKLILQAFQNYDGHFLFSAPFCPYCTFCNIYVPFNIFSEICPFPGLNHG